jgi:hypothetical protein
MSGQDLRKLMNLMESASSKGEYYVDSEGDDHHVFHTDKGEGKAYGTHSSKEAAQKDADTRNGKVDESTVNEALHGDYSFESPRNNFDGLVSQLITNAIEWGSEKNADAKKRMHELASQLRFVLGKYEKLSSGKQVEETAISEEVVGMDTDAALWEIFNLGSKYGKNQPGNGKFFNKANQIIDELVTVIGPTITNKSVMEAKNANAQQKGINFSGTPAKKNSGDMDQSSPKSKAPGSKTPLAQAKSGTRVGQIKS